MKTFEVIADDGTVIYSKLASGYPPNDMETLASQVLAYLDASLPSVVIPLSASSPSRASFSRFSTTSLVAAVSALLLGAAVAVIVVRHGIKSRAGSSRQT